ncbi:spore germination protein [Bacillus sp. BHET2]|uniref:spore germination protein n=1 Tax=Bacillus sp. BHET2 TaxID=2583818 RepID=UPI00110D7FD3|nr:spore germination protein [Bacillus sp. BHET2]TMU86932.1 spore germination protein [Bacillus sp. BHET2]
MRRSFSKRTTRKLINPTVEKQDTCDTPAMNLEEKVTFIREGLFLTDDLSIRNLIFNEKQVKLMFIDSIVEVGSIQNSVIKPMQENPFGHIKNVVYGANVNETVDLQGALDALVDGHCLLIIEDEECMFLISAPKNQSAHRIEPINEKVIRGSHQGFSENVAENVQFIRERITNRKVTVKYSHVGVTTKTKYALVSISTLTDPELAKTIEERITYIKADAIQSPGYFEEFLEDSSFSPFPQFLNTERPDRVVANLMEGRMALLMEGSPTALIFPVSFFSFFQTSEDYNSRSFIASFLRLIRLVSFITTLCLPAFYIAVISYNYEVIPVEIIFSIKSSLEYLPFPPLIEAAIMQFTLELLREAAIRLPNPVAQTIGVVGGLVIGTAVVDANFVSNTMVIVVAITAISSFVIPSNELSTSVRILGFPLMVLASLFGFFGIVIGLMITLIHMSKLKSLGHYYLYPMAPFDVKAFKDAFIRVPIWLMKERPRDLKAIYKWKTTNPRGWKKNEQSD